MDNKYFLYFNNWWNGFFNGIDANNINFFKKLFSLTKYNNFEITNNLDKANILIEAGKPIDEIINKKEWILKINFIGEPVLPDHNKYDIVLTGSTNIPNCIDLPISVMYTLGNNYFEKINNKNKIINSIPPNFCCFVVSNPNSPSRNKMFDIINNYKKVNSAGRYKNNTNNSIVHLNWWSTEYINYLKTHKFMICFENTKMENYSTEKIINAFLANTIPIYWATHEIKKLFNENALLFLEDESEESFKNLLDKIIELDNNNEKYLEFINRPRFTDENLKYWEQNYTFNALANKINLFN